MSQRPNDVQAAATRAIRSLEDEDDDGEDELLPGYFAETFQDFALGAGFGGGGGPGQSDLEAAAGAGYFSGELPTASLLEPTEEQAARFEETGDVFSLDVEL